MDKQTAISRLESLLDDMRQEYFSDKIDPEWVEELRQILSGLQRKD